MRLSRMSVLVVVVVLVAAWGGLAAANEEEGILVPDFSLVSSAGEVVRLSDFRGQVVVLNFWATWCPYCLEEMQILQELHQEWSETGEAVLLLLDQVDGQFETEESGAKYLADHGYTMTNLLDYGTIGYQMFGIPGLPTTVVIDGEGYFFDYIVGPVTKEGLSKMVEAAK